MCENCIYSTMCNFDAEDCEEFQDTDLYIEKNKILFRDEFFKMLDEINAENFSEV